MERKVRARRRWHVAGVWGGAVWAGRGWSSTVFKLKDSEPVNVQKVPQYLSAAVEMPTDTWQGATGRIRSVMPSYCTI